MLFNSLSYLIFLPTVVLLFWVCPLKLRTPLLLIASYVFYMFWKPVYGLLIFGLTFANFFMGLTIHKSNKLKKLWLITAIAFNLVALAFFKYAYFFHDLLKQLVCPLGKSIPDIPFQIILPLGISFFVFEFIHYLTDVYKGGSPVKSFAAFALFASFFPTQIAGPIKRYQDFIPQLSLPRKIEIASFDQGISLILFGLFKKVLFADNLAVVVQSAFAHPDLVTTLDMWLSVYAFAFQIYFDFSGYTDIARGSALLLGFKVPPNFNLPYMAGSISDFWHRWHISLSTWLRDYLYIPCGGSKGTRLTTYRNLLITMILGGLWHGAAMHFLVWGAYQGVLLVLHKEYRCLTQSWKWLTHTRNTSLFHAFSQVITFHAVAVGWVFFRADNMASVKEIMGKLFFLQDIISSHNLFNVSIVSASTPIVFMLLPAILLLLFAGQLLSYWQSTSRGQRLPVPKMLKPILVAAAISLLVVFSPDTSPRFIYFQF